MFVCECKIINDIFLLFKNSFSFITPFVYIAFFRGESCGMLLQGVSRMAWREQGRLKNVHSSRRGKQRFEERYSSESAGMPLLSHAACRHNGFGRSWGEPVLFAPWSQHITHLTCSALDSTGGKKNRRISSVAYGPCSWCTYYVCMWRAHIPHIHTYLARYRTLRIMRRLFLVSPNGCLLCCVT